MRSNLLKKMFLLLLTVPFLGNSQVGIGTVDIEDGVMLQLENNNKGFLLPRIALASRVDSLTIVPNAVEGLLVYNTATAGGTTEEITPGMYFWDGTRWERLYNDGYTEQFIQTAMVKARNQTDSYLLTGLDQTITPPYSGTYQVMVVCYYAAGHTVIFSRAGIGTASVWVEIDGVKMSETWLTSTSKILNFGEFSFCALGQSALLIFNVDLEAETSYNFQVWAREWAEINTNNQDFDGIWGYGYWGVDTSVNYVGNEGGDPNTQDNYMTITLLNQF